MLRSNRVLARCLLSSVCCLVCPGLPSEMIRACDRLHLRHRSSYQVRGSIYQAYNFQLTVPSSRIERLLDPTTYTYASHMKPQTAMFLHILANHVRLCYFARCSATA